VRASLQLETKPDIEGLFRQRAERSPPRRVTCRGFASAVDPSRLLGRLSRVALAAASGICAGGGGAWRRSLPGALERPDHAAKHMTTAHYLTPA
jgi:hypothetical protein